MRKLDIPYKIGNDYFIDSMICAPFYLVSLRKEINVSWRSENEGLPSDEVCVKGFFRKCGGGPRGGIYTYKLDLDKSKMEYKPIIQEDSND